MQVGITRMLAQRGLAPTVVAGHSVGEVAAAWASGALSLAEAVQVIYQRSRLQGTTKGQGQMCAIALGQEAALALLAELGLEALLALAGVNSARGVTIAGDPEQLAILEAALEARNIFHKRLDLDYAFHSAAMDGIEVELKAVLAELEPRDRVKVNQPSTPRSAASGSVAASSTPNTGGRTSANRFSSSRRSTPSWMTAQTSSSKSAPIRSCAATSTTA
jgi:acyl transferase domain-containing protein